jgi:hypothetical protein
MNHQGIDLVVVNLKNCAENFNTHRLILLVFHRVYVERGMSYYRIATIAMLFGTGELMLAVAMNGSAQIGMFIMAGLSYFVSGACYHMHKKDQYNYIPNAEKYV